MLIKQLVTIVLTALIYVSTPLNAIASETVHHLKHHLQSPLKITTFEGAHNPPYHHYIITFTNLFSTEVKVKKVQRTD